MMQPRSLIRATILFLTVGVLTGPGTTAQGQVIQRESSVTGPRGRTLERKVTSERRNGTIHRELEITRPGGATLQREVTVQGPRAAGMTRPPAPMPRPGFGPGPGPGYRPRGGYGWGGPPVIQRNVIIDRRPSMGAAVGGFAAGSLLGLAVGNALASPPPPPPVYFVPEPVYAAPPVVVVNPPVRYQPVPQPVAPAVVVDPVSDGLTQLKSHWWENRRDGALELGRLGDARATLALIDRLKNDHDKNVRQASAWALGEIRDPRGVPALEHAAALDRRDEVRDVAAKAYHKVLEAQPTEEMAAAPTPTSGTTRGQRLAPPPYEPVDDADLDPAPPPPPTPAPARTGSRPTLNAPR